jgi:SAM-dependent methyltransferase
LAEGHAAHIVVGLDRNFFQLWTAQYWVAPKNRFVCADADQPFPFADKSFSGTLCCDAFHYFRRKDKALGEIARCAPGQPVLLARVGNKLVEPNEGFELTPGAYLELVGGTWRVFGEEELLNLYLRRQPVDLVAPRSAGNVNHEKWLSLVHPGDPREVVPLARALPWPHAVGRLQINPIYTVEKTSEGGWDLRFRFPSRHFAYENERMTSYHPSQIRLTDQTYSDVRANRHTLEVERLIGHFAAIGLPDRYV